MRIIIEARLRHIPEEPATYGEYGQLNSPREPDYFEAEDITITQGPKHLPVGAIQDAIEEAANENKQLLLNHEQAI